MILPPVQRFSLAFVLTLAGALPPAHAQVGDDVDALLDERVEAADQKPLADLWNDARMLATLVGDEMGGAFDSAVDDRLRDGGDRSGRALLFLAATRLFGEDVDYELIVQRLQPLLSSSDSELAIATAELLGTRDLRGELAVDPREELADEMLRVARDGAIEPDQRVACAVAAYEIGSGAQISASQRVLFEFMDSSDPGLRAKGALALASIDAAAENPAVESELKRIARLPGPSAALATAYLKQIDILRLKETQLRRMKQSTTDSSTRRIGTTPDLQRVDSVINLVLREHLEGDVVTREELIEAALDGMLRSLDQHSAYFSPKVFKRFEQDLEAEYGGIGAYVREDPDDKLFTITRPIYSGPAYEAGLQTDDKIVRIDDWPTLGESQDDIIKRLKGRPKTPVKLYVWRRGMDPSLIDRPSEDMAVTIQRDQIVIPPVHSDMLPGGIGLVELTTFSRVASQELYKRLADMKDRGLRGLILDLRNNSGGLLSEARNVSELFLPAGKVVVSTESRVGRERSYPTQADAFVPEDIPVVVLINRFSASASEIVAGALQDHGRAVLVGQRSYGKGSVQNLILVPNERDDEFADENRNRRFDNWESITKDWNQNGEFDFAPRVKLTVERYLLPTGRSIHRELDEEGNLVSPGGVEPDEEVAPKRWPQWKLEEILRIQGDRTVQTWARERFADNRQLFEQLAAGDMDDSSRYPEFAELYASLDTTLTEADVRFLARREARRLVQDARGEAFPLGGDYQEDLQLQQAIRSLLAEIGDSVDDVPAYAATFDEAPEGSGRKGPRVAKTSGLDRDRLERAQALIAEASDGNGRISDEGLQTLSEIIEDALQNKN